jgi:dipeptidyl aminopeptidase/acylaminoacyl peptidase
MRFMATADRTAAPPRQGPKPSFEQYTAIRRYQSALALSPDGAQVAYSVNTSGQYNLWRQPSDGGYPRQVTLSAEHAVREIDWSPDGGTFLYTADRNGDEFHQVYTVPVDGGRPRQFPSEADVQHYLGMGGSWSPDGSQVAFAGNDRDPTEQDLVIRDMLTGEERRLLTGEAIYFPAGWSPDGARLLALELLSNTNTNILLVDVADGSSRRLTEHEGEVKYFPVGWSPDGAGFYLVTDEDREFTGLAFHDLATDKRRWVEAPEWDVEDAAIAKDGSRLVWSVNEDGYSRVRARALGSDVEPVELKLPDGVLDVMALSRDGERLAVLWERATHPEEVFTVDLTTGAATQITESALGGVDADALTEPELIRYPTFDGREIPAWLYRPAGVTGRMPVLLSIHGGPEAQERPRYAYSGLYQYLTSRGIAVLAPNIRGSTGYGKSYQTLIHRDWGGDELKDLEAAAVWLRGRDWIDSTRMGAYGGSFGGFATLSCVSRLPEYWAAAVDLVGPANLVTFAKAVPPTWRRMMAQWVGDPETEAEFLMERSPITYVDRITAPLFVIQGANDPRVVKAESDQIVERLRSRGVEVRYDVYEDEGHGFTKRENELKAMQDIATFLEQYLLPGGSASKRS